MPLNGLDRGTISWVNVIRVAIVGQAVRVVIVWVVVVGVVGKEISREKSIIQSKPETVVKHKEAAVIKMSMPAIPVVVPICVMTFSDVVVDPAIHSALRKCLRWTHC